MSLPITAIRPPVAIDSIELQPSQKPAEPGAFASALTQALGNLQASQNSANASVQQFLSGENEEVHQVAIATQKAQLEFDMFMAVRNKVVSAYQEVMRMQM